MHAEDFPVWAYLAALPLRRFVLCVSSGLGTYFLQWLQNYNATEAQLNLWQYRYHLTGLLTAKFWMRRTLAALNGISEELLMRIFFMGILIQDFKFSPFESLILSVLLSAIHHSRQGRILGSIAVLPAQALFAMVFLFSQEIAFFCLAHICADWIGYVSNLKTNKIA